MIKTYKIKSELYPKNITIPRKTMEQLVENNDIPRETTVTFIKNRNILELNRKLALYLVDTFDFISLVKDNGEKYNIKDDLDEIQKKGIMLKNELLKIAKKEGMPIKGVLSNVSIVEIKKAIRDKRAGVK